MPPGSQTTSSCQMVILTGVAAAAMKAAGGVEDGVGDTLGAGAGVGVLTERTPGEPVVVGVGVLTVGCGAAVSRRPVVVVATAAVCRGAVAAAPALSVACNSARR